MPTAQDRVTTAVRTNGAAPHGLEKTKRIRRTKAEIEAARLADAAACLAGRSTRTADAASPDDQTTAPALLVDLVKLLPPAGTTLSESERAGWLHAVEINFGLIYPKDLT